MSAAGAQERLHSEYHVSPSGVYPASHCRNPANAIRDVSGYAFGVSFYSRPLPNHSRGPISFAKLLLPLWAVGHVGQEEYKVV